MDLFFPGCNVRIDTTLLGFENMAWQRGSRSYIFKGNGEWPKILKMTPESAWAVNRVLSGNVCSDVIKTRTLKSLSWDEVHFHLVSV